jgi:hypothetical protein
MSRGGTAEWHERGVGVVQAIDGCPSPSQALRVETWLR